MFWTYYRHIITYNESFSNGLSHVTYPLPNCIQRSKPFTIVTEHSETVVSSQRERYTNTHTHAHTRTFIADGNATRAANVYTILVPKNLHIAVNKKSIINGL